MFYSIFVLMAILLFFLDFSFHLIVAQKGALACFRFEVPQVWMLLYCVIEW